MNALERGELARKCVHIGMGLFALFLGTITWRQAALAALAALAFNLFVLPRLGGAALSRPHDVTRGYPLGILLYPAVVLLLILLFRENLAIAAAGWGLLAFGDGFATLAGTALGGRALPWNPGKTWSGLASYVVCGATGSALLYAFVARGLAPASDARPLSSFEIGALVIAALAGAALESLPSELDDNLLPPLAGAAALAALLIAHAGAAELSWPSRIGTALVMNGVLAGVGTGLGLVRRSGGVAGFAYGTVLYTFGGGKLYILLWVFFGVGTLVTKLGKRRKEALGKAEAAGGRRGAANVFANVTVAAFCAFAYGLSGTREAAGLFALAGAAAFATALMDTVGTEVGQAVRTPTVLLPDFRPVPPGTDGAVSIAGTAAGFAAACLVAFAAAEMMLVTLRGAAIILVSASAGTVLESLLGRAGAPWRVSNGHVLNLYNTLAGAICAAILAGPLGALP